MARLCGDERVRRRRVEVEGAEQRGGDPEKLAAVKQALERAGVIFIEKNGEGPGVRLRRFLVGDRVRFKPQTQIWRSFDIAADEVGTVVAVEPHPRRTGPTYKMEVELMVARIADSTFSAAARTSV